MSQLQEREISKNKNKIAKAKRILKINKTQIQHRQGGKSQIDMKNRKATQSIPAFCCTRIYFKRFIIKCNIINAFFMFHPRDHKIKNISNTK